MEWLSNKLRIKLKDALLRQGIKMEEFVTTFRNLLCVCDEDGKKKPHLKEINGIKQSSRAQLFKANDNVS